MGPNMIAASAGREPFRMPGRRRGDARRVCGAQRRSAGHRVRRAQALAARRFSERRGWYEPIGDPDAIARAVHYVLGRPSLFLALSSDYRLLHHILEAASHPAPMPSDKEMAADRESFGIDQLFDGGELERF
jgi:hypothetical protein